MPQVLIFIIGLLAGVCGGLFGIGGGSIMIPALVYAFGYSQHMAQGTTLAAMLLPIGLLAAVKYWQHGNVNVQAAGILAAGFFLGGFFGATGAQVVPDLLLKKLFGIFLLVVSLNMILGK